MVEKWNPMNPQGVESSQPAKHEDHVAGKGVTPMTHHNLVHKFLPAVEKVKSKKEVILEAQRDKKKVHFATLMDTCHLKNAELELQLHKYKGRVVLRGDIVRDQSGAYAVFTEQGSSASQMTAA